MALSNRSVRRPWIGARLIAGNRDFETAAVSGGGSQRVIDDLTLLIPTTGRPQLRSCLESIARGAAWPASIIVVDQGENPAVPAWLASLEELGLHTTHLPSTQHSASSARNRAIERITTRHAAALDDDCIPERAWLERLHARLRQHPGALITGRCLPAGEGLAPTLVTSPVPRIHTRPTRRFPSPMASGNLGFAMDTARRIGPFDEKLAQAEDNDWAYRALRAGIPIVYAPEVIVEHFHWRNDDELAEVYRAYARSQGAFYGKYVRRGDWWMAMRTAEALLRLAYTAFSGLVINDTARRHKGYTKFIQMLSGVIAGLRGVGTR